jgi:hypothetical protein
MEIAIIGDDNVGLALALNLEEELRARLDRYKRIAGYSIEDLATPAARSGDTGSVGRLQPGC